MIACLVLSILAPTLKSEPPLPFVRPFLRRGHHFIVCAHRGNHVNAPENTLSSLREAIRVGVDYVEVDVRTSRDGELVIMHDSTVDRTTSGHGKVRDLSLSELRHLSINGAKDASEHVPTLDEMLTLGRGKVNFYLDIKDVTPAQVLPVLRRRRMEHSVIAYVYSPEQIAQWKQEAPTIPLISDLDAMQSAAQIEADWRKGAFAISDGNALDYRREFVEAWHALKVAVVPDIQNPGESPAQWQPLIDQGVDGLQTDHPEALIKFLTEKGIR